MADKEALSVLKSGVDVWNIWRQGLEYDLVAHDSETGDTVLTGPDLSDADLSDADLSDADLSDADLTGANLTRAILDRATFDTARLFRANLSGASLRRAVLSFARVGSTTFGDIDLSEVKGLGTVRHIGPSTIGIDTIFRSKGNIPHTFLLGAGVPQEAINYLLRLAGQGTNYYSCFISHSNKDKFFVEQLHTDLQAKGVRCWYAPEDLKIGEPFLLGIDQGIRHHDKLLLVLSEHSVNSGWVQHEVLSAMAKEQGKAPWVLFPIRVDDAVMNTNVPWATMIRESRHIGDFTHWKRRDNYQKALGTLLRDLSARD